MREPIEVRLAPAELIQAATAGAWRHVQSLNKGLVDRHGEKGGQAGWQKHIEGAAGELAVAKALGIYWPGAVGTFHAPDLGRNLQVRTRSNHSWDLIVREGDPDEDVFILVTGLAPLYRIHGCIVGHLAKLPEFVQDHGGHGAAYFVPAASLDRFEGRNDG